MARRDLTDYRTVSQVQAPRNIDSIGLVAAVTDKIIESSQEAKINEGVSSAQLELGKLNQEYKIKYEGNPFDEQGLKNYKAAQSSIFNKYGSQVSPMFKSVWNESVARLQTGNELNIQAWQYTQAKKNTINSINQSLKNNYSQAIMDGQQFAGDPTQALSSGMNYEDSLKQLTEFGNKNLGEETTKELLNSYKQDYTKSYITGVMDTDPMLALKILDQSGIEERIGDGETYMRLKDAAESRALNYQAMQGKKEVLDTMRNENNILTKSLDKPLNYAELNMELEKGDYSAAAKSFFLKANGFTNKTIKEATSGAKPMKLSNAEKLETQANIHNEVAQLSVKDDLTVQDVSSLQNRIYEALDAGAITKKQGADYLSVIVSPLADQLEGKLTDFSDGSWNPLKDNVGFSDVQKYYNENVAIEETDKTPALTKVSNAQNKISLYNGYYASLSEIAEQKGISLAELPNSPQRNSIYIQAAQEAKVRYTQEKYPNLSTLNDTPNQILDNGKLIQGAAGNRNIKPDFTVAPKFEVTKTPDGKTWRKLSNGFYEEINPDISQ